MDAASAAIGHGLALTAAEFRVLAFVSLVELHPCQQAASHLPCTRPPDRLLPNRSRNSLRGSRRGSNYRAAQRAFVTTRSGFDTMARRRQETDDDITEADDTAGAATAARHLVLRARALPIGRLHPAAPAAPVALSLLRLLLSTPTGVTKASTTNTTLSPPSFKTTT